MPGKEFYKDMEKSEIVVAQYLNEMGFEWYYEHPVFVYDEKKRPRVWTPDFYIPSLQLYIEVCGSKNFDYSYRKKIFLENDISVVFLHFYKKSDEWKSWLKKSIFEIEETRHNKTMSLIKKFLSK